jgi:CSLREA domain-containing protein
MSLFKRLLTLCLAFLLSLGTLFGSATPVFAAAIMVNTTADTADAAPGNGICADSTGACSLRAAIEELNATEGGGAISIPAGSYIVNSPLIIEEAMNISGAGRDLTLLDGNGESRVLEVRSIEWLICDSTTNSVASYSQNGHRNPDLVPHNYGDIAIPGGIAVDGDNQVLRYDGESGEFKGAFVSAGLGGLAMPRGLVFHNESLYIASEATDAILQYDATNGDFIGTFVNPGSGGLDAPTDLAFGPDGDLYVISSDTQEVLRYNGSTGVFIKAFLSGGDMNLGNPSCLKWRTGANYGAALNLGGITIQNGYTSESISPTSGLVVEYGAWVSAWRVAIRNNQSPLTGGGVHNAGYLSLNDSEVSGNALTQVGNGVTPTGGGIYNSGTLRLNRSLVYNNFATRGGGISNGGLALINNSTISANRAVGSGGGIYNGIDGEVRLNFVTITDNQANAPYDNTVTISERVGGGIYNAAEAQIDMGNSILAGNTDGLTRYDAGFSPDCYSLNAGGIVSQRDNLVGILTDECLFEDANLAGLPFDQVGTAEMPLDIGCWWAGAVLGRNDEQYSPILYD